MRKQAKHVVIGGCRVSQLGRENRKRQWGNKTRECAGDMPRIVLESTDTWERQCPSATCMHMRVHMRVCMCSCMCIDKCIDICIECAQTHVQACA